LKQVRAFVPWEGYVSLDQIGTYADQHIVPNNTNVQPTTLLGWMVCYVNYEVWKAFVCSVSDECLTYFRAECVTRTALLSALSKIPWVSGAGTEDLFRSSWSSFASQLFTYGGQFYVVTIAASLCCVVLDNTIIGVRPSYGQVYGCAVEFGTFVQVGDLYLCSDSCSLMAGCAGGKVVPYVANSPMRGHSLDERLGLPPNLVGTSQGLVKYTV